MKKLSSYRDVIRLWRTRATLARHLGTKGSIVRGWYLRDSVPEKYFAGIIEAAAACGFKRVTYRLLSEMEAGAELLIAADPDDEEFDEPI
jgi:hypothetical protein